jgi:hypothetical protein
MEGRGLHIIDFDKETLTTHRSRENDENKTIKNRLILYFVVILFLIYKILDIIINSVTVLLDRYIL